MNVEEDSGNSHALHTIRQLFTFEVISELSGRFSSDYTQTVEALERRLASYLVVADLLVLLDGCLRARDVTRPARRVRGGEVPSNCGPKWEPTCWPLRCGAGDGEDRQKFPVVETAPVHGPRSPGHFSRWMLHFPVARDGRLPQPVASAGRVACPSVVEEAFRWEPRLHQYVFADTTIPPRSGRGPGSATCL